MTVPAGVILGFIRPAIPVDLHERDARFHQTAGQQHTLTELAPAIPVARRGGLALQVKGIAGSWRAQQVVGLLPLTVMRQECVYIGDAQTGLDLLQERAAVINPSR